MSKYRHNKKQKEFRARTQTLAEFQLSTILHSQQQRQTLEHRKARKDLEKEYHELLSSLKEEEHIESEGLYLGLYKAKTAIQSELEFQRLNGEEKGAIEEIRSAMHSDRLAVLQKELNNNLTPALVADLRTIKTGQGNSVKSIISKILALEPENNNALTWYATASMYLREYSDAVKSYEKHEGILLRKNPQYKLSSYDAANYLWAQSECKESEKDIDAAITKMDEARNVPGIHASYKTMLEGNLATLYAKHAKTYAKELEEKVEDYQKAHALAPNVKSYETSLLEALKSQFAELKKGFNSYYDPIFTPTTPHEKLRDAHKSLIDITDKILKLETNNIDALKWSAGARVPRDRAHGFRSPQWQEIAALYKALSALVTTPLVDIDKTYSLFADAMTSQNIDDVVLKMRGLYQPPSNTQSFLQNIITLHFQSALKIKISTLITQKNFDETVQLAKECESLKPYDNRPEHKATLAYTEGLQLLHRGDIAHALEKFNVAKERSNGESFCIPQSAFLKELAQLEKLNEELAILINIEPEVRLEIIKEDGESSRVITLALKCWNVN